MEFFTADPEVERLPPSETRILDLHAAPDPDGRRIRLSLDLTPFQKRPYIELTLNDSDGQEASSASIVEPMGWKLELTLHIRKPAPPLPPEVPGGTIDPASSKMVEYTLTAVLSYPDLGEVDRRKITVVCAQP